MRRIDSSAEIAVTDIPDPWLRGRVELFIDMVELANECDEDVTDFLEGLYEHSGLEKVVAFKVFKTGIVFMGDDVGGKE